MAKARIVNGMPADDWKWKVERAVETLIEAEEIKADPKLFKAAKAELDKKQKAVARAATDLGRAVMRKANGKQT